MVYIFCSYLSFNLMYSVVTFTTVGKFGKQQAIFTLICTHSRTDKIMQNDCNSG